MIFVSHIFSVSWSAVGTRSSSDSRHASNPKVASARRDRLEWLLRHRSRPKRHHCLAPFPAVDGGAAARSGEHPAMI